MPGYKTKSTLFKEIGTNFFFKCSKKVKDTVYLSCHAKMCPAKLIISKEGKKKRGFHNHVAADTHFEKELVFVDQCKQRALKTTDSLRHIFDSEIEK